MSKHADIRLTRNIASDYTSQNIYVNAVCPGLIYKDLTSLLLSSYGGKGNKGLGENLLIEYPTRRFGTPDEVANVIAFVASDETSYICGSIVVLDNGRTVI